jgi:hypothetical protein
MHCKVSFGLVICFGLFGDLIRICGLVWYLWLVMQTWSVFLGFDGLVLVKVVCFFLCARPIVLV